MAYRGQRAARNGDPIDKLVQYIVLSKVLGGFRILLKVKISEINGTETYWERIKKCTT